MLCSIREHVQTVNVALEGFEKWHSALFTLNPTESSDVDFEVVNTWTSELNGYMAALAGILQQCTRLRLLRLEARRERHPPQLCLQRRDYLMALPLASLLSISHLTCLEVDTAGTYLIDTSTTSRVHLCNNISAMVPTLRRLRCRMSSICPTIFNVSGSGLLLDLEEVIINLSLSDICGSDTSYRYPSRCGVIPGDNFLRLKADMESHAREFVLALNNPRLVRILWHTFPGLDLHSFDVLTERRMILAPGAPWNADGEEIEDRVVEQDLFESDSSSEDFLI